MSEETQQEWSEVVPVRADAHDWDKNPQLTGVLTEVKEDIGPNESTLYQFQLKDGSPVSMWGSAMLDDLMKNVMIGEETRVEFLGMVISPKTKRSYRTFKVYHRVVKV